MVTSNQIDGLDDERMLQNGIYLGFVKLLGKIGVILSIFTDKMAKNRLKIPKIYNYFQNTQDKMS